MAWDSAANLLMCCLPFVRDHYCVEDRGSLLENVTINPNVFWKVPECNRKQRRRQQRLSAIA
jgi:hypothetical protein